MMLRYLLSLVVACFTISLSAQEDSHHLKKGRQHVQVFYKGGIGETWTAFNQHLKTELGTVAHLDQFRQSLEQLAGLEENVLGERIDTIDNRTYYLRMVRYTKLPEVFYFGIGFDANDSIADFYIRPAQQGEAFQYTLQNNYRLPVTGNWYVASGGRDSINNANHYLDYASRFAIDLVALADTVFSSAVPRPNEAYKSFGSIIVAPAAGTIAAMRNDVPDNQPGILNTKEPHGNYIIIDHGKGEYSLLAHLQYNSIHVQAGSKVKAGDILARCGNSGNSNGPHLHYSLISRPHPVTTMSLPVAFTDFYRNGTLVQKGELKKGDTISDHQAK